MIYKEFLDKLHDLTTRYEKQIKVYGADFEDFLTIELYDLLEYTTGEEDLNGDAPDDMVSDISFCED